MKMTKELEKAVSLGKDFDWNNPTRLDDMIYLLLSHVKQNGSEKPFDTLLGIFRCGKVRFKFLSDNAQRVVAERIENTAYYVQLWNKGTKSANVKQVLKNRGFIGGRNVA